MKIGIISDTHDNILAIEKAIDIFRKENVELIIHAGDWNAAFSLAKFSKLKAKLCGVFGNVDGDREMLLKEAEKIGAKIFGEFGEIEVNGVKIAIIHGKDESIVRSVAKSGDYDVVIRGHTHYAKVERLNGTLIVNPGECCGWLTGKKTIAILDSQTMKVDVIEIR